MRRTRHLARLCLLVSMTLAGCLPTPAASRSPVSPLSTIALPTSPAGALPEVAFSDLVVRQGDDQGAWIILGTARNESDSALESVAVFVQLVDAAGTATSETTVPLPLSVLQPGAVSPFTAQLEQAEEPAEARASLESFEYSSEAAARISLGPVYTTQAPDGVIVYGTLRPSDTIPLRVRDMVVTWRDKRGSLAGLAIASVPGAIVTADESLPWIALAPGAASGTHFEVFGAASAADSQSETPLVVTDGPTWRKASPPEPFATRAMPRSFRRWRSRRSQPTG
jgi:hypothetical protein